MLSFVARTLINAVALVIIASLSNGQIHVGSFVEACGAAVFLGAVNAVVKPVLYFFASLMTCALSCLTLGLWSLVLSWLINGFLFFCAGQLFSGFVVRTFSAALWGALALSVVNALAGAITAPDEDR